MYYKGKIKYLLERKKNFKFDIVKVLYVIYIFWVIIVINDEYF